MKNKKEMLQSLLCVFKLLFSIDPEKFFLGFILFFHFMAVECTRKKSGTAKDRDYVYSGVFLVLYMYNLFRTSGKCFNLNGN